MIMPMTICDNCATKAVPEVFPRDSMRPLAVNSGSGVAVLLPRAFCVVVAGHDSGILVHYSIRLETRSVSGFSNAHGDAQQRTSILFGGEKARVRLLRQRAIMKRAIAKQARGLLKRLFFMAALDGPLRSGYAVERSLQVRP
jgi:hypothetical protein